MSTVEMCIIKLTVFLRAMSALQCRGIGFKKNQNQTCTQQFLDICSVCLDVCWCRYMNRYWREIINSQFKQLLFSMINRVWPSPELCQMSQLLWKKKELLEWVSWTCVWHRVGVCVCVCVFSRLLYAVVWHSPWQLWTFHSARTVREREGERERVRWEGGGENHVRRWGWSEEFVCEGRRHTCLYVLAQ